MTLNLYQQKIDAFLKSCSEKSVASDLIINLEQIKVNKGHKDKIIIQGFKLAYLYQKIENIKQLSQFPIVEEFCQNKLNLNEILSNSILNLNPNFLTFILTDPLFDKINIHFNKDLILRKAIKKDKWSFVKFLLTSKELKKNSNIYVLNNEILLDLIDDYKRNELKFLITECKVTIPDNLKEEMINLGNFGSVLQAIKESDIAKLKEKLETDLSNTSTTKSKLKI